MEQHGEFSDDHIVIIWWNNMVLLSLVIINFSVDSNDETNFTDEFSLVSRISNSNSLPEDEILQIE